MIFIVKLTNNTWSLAGGPYRSLQEAAKDKPDAFKLPTSSDKGLYFIVKEIT